MFKNMNLSRRLGLGFSMLMVIMLILIWVGVMGMKVIDGGMERIVTVNMVRIDLISKMDMDMSGVAINVRNIILNKNSENRQEYNQRIAKFHEGYDSNFKKIEEMTNSSDSRAFEIINKLKDETTTWKNVNARIIELAMANNDEEAEQVSAKEGGPAERMVGESVDALKEHNMGRNRMRHDEAVATYIYSRNSMIALGGAAILLAIGAVVFLTRSILRQLGADPKELGEVANMVAVGDLSRQITLAAGDTTSVMAAMKKMADAIGALTGDADMLGTAAMEGRLNTRADAAKHQGDFKKLIKGVNTIFDRLVGLLDAMPAPAMLIDRDFNVLYMNKAGAGAGNRNQQQVAGTKCFDHFRTSDCKTDKCACGRAMAS
ncbi:MAG: MCP four helix bundle domain-containing protein, partial [Desulfobulbaceae bacterium]|nr:MCP four helix bundle domain-containing protein [Desulfobulbaceae bacterium]